MVLCCEGFTVRKIPQVQGESCGTGVAKNEQARARTRAIWTRRVKGTILMREVTFSLAKSGVQNVC